ncbi:hypothetical protein LTR96_011244 [Exophiala xenobiotica]|nr:hypothetical protein LTR92_010937 [Exophiala xenobiotica]KAK5263351.1 hypothetical protein LTR96_011244 [Exophiala xenobiotica]KAK5332765.1 hypothetical protein LTR98_011102 [Exophiala xenobiotica]
MPSRPISSAHPKEYMLTIYYQALIDMVETDDPSVKANLASICGILFFGVPSQGMQIESLIPMVGDQSNRSLLESLGPNSPVLRTQNTQFPKVLQGNNTRLVLFFETHLSPTARKDENGVWRMDGPSTILVDPASATHGQGYGQSSVESLSINRTHSFLVKFSRHDQEYQTVLRILSALIQVSRPVLLPRIHGDHNGFKTELLRKDEISVLDGTCEWLIKHPIFESWQRQPNSLLWVRGKPGAAKSAVMKFAVLHAEKHKTREPEILASFFFHGRGSELVRTPVGLFRSLLKQILPYFPQYLADLDTIFRERRISVTENGAGIPVSSNVSSKKLFQKLPLSFQSQYTSTLWTKLVKTARHLVALLDSGAQSPLKPCLCAVSLNNDDDMIERQSLDKVDSYSWTYTMSSFDYATTSWPSHAICAEEEGIDQAEMLHCWQWPSNVGIHRWCERFREIEPFHEDNPIAGYEDETAKSMTLLHVAAMYGLQSVVAAILVNTEVDKEVPDGTGRTALSWAAENDKINVATFLLKCPEADPHVLDNAGESPLTYAAKYSGAGMMKAFLARDFALDEDLLSSAATNERSGTEIMQLLLSKKAGNIIIDHAVVEAAADNWDSGVEVVEVLIKHTSTTFSTSALAAIVSKFKSNVIRMLLEKKAAQMELNADLVNAAARSNAGGRHTIFLLLGEENLVLLPSGFQRIATLFDADVMQYVLGKKGGHLIVTREVVIAAAKNKRGGQEVLSILLENRPTKMGPKAFEEIVTLFDTPLVQLAFAERHREIRIDQDLIQAAARNCTHGIEVFKLLLEKGVLSSGREGLAMVISLFGAGVMESVLALPSSEVKVDEAVVAAAASCDSGTEVMTTLLGQPTTDIHVTEAMVSRVARSFDCKVMNMLLDRRPFKVTITEAIVKEAARNYGNGADVMAALLEHPKADIDVTAELVRTAAESFNGKVMTLLLGKKGLPF